MASTSERSFGSRLESARKLKTNLQSFQNYQPESGEFSINDFELAIQDAENINPLIASSKLVYRQAVAERRELYISLPSSIKKTITPVAAFIRAKFGRNSSTYAEVNGLALKIRGVKLRTQTTVDANTHSVAQQSYGSVLLNFENMISDLQGLGSEYNPANQQIEISQLTELKNNATEKNNNVVIAFGNLNPKQNERNIIFNTLSAKAQRIKDFVKSQYGINSSEYKLIKGLKI